MSYDLMVFEKTKAPKTKDKFLEWFQEYSEWGGDPDHQNIGVASPALQNWFMEMKETFPPMNGEYAPDDDALAADEGLESRMADYDIGQDIIYVAFAWSVAEEAYKQTLALARKHGVGLFNASSDDGEIILPDGSKLD